MRLHLASGNAHKAAEFATLAAIAGLPVEIVGAQGAGGMPVVAEDAGTFVGNARKKAGALLARLPAGSWVLADDSGLCVAALGGGPGVESAYYAGPEGDSAANLRKLVETMEGVPAEQRQAYFACVLVLIDAEGSEHVFEGRCEGALREVPVGAGGFGYDPLLCRRARRGRWPSCPRRRKTPSAIAAGRGCGWPRGCAAGNDVGRIALWSRGALAPDACRTRRGRRIPNKQARWGQHAPPRNPISRRGTGPNRAHRSRRCDRRSR